jgi:hypothetical protein
MGQHQAPEPLPPGLEAKGLGKSGERAAGERRGGGASFAMKKARKFFDAEEFVPFKRYRAATARRFYGSALKSRP